MSLKALSLFTEPYGSTGNIGENFLRLLGTPSLNPLQTVIREAVQNVADAAKLGSGPEILIRLRRLTEGQRERLRDKVLVELPEERASRASLERFLASNQAVVLEICDFGTTGLGGPTRADRIPVGTDKTDFINFLRNIGTPRDTDHGGGTYGFGKASLYAVSRCRTILVDTLVADELSERRLIGCHIGAKFEVPEDGMRRQFTGRHWWGVKDPRDGIADPATGPEAAELGAALGLPDRTVGQTGTSIMILDFETEGEELQVIGRRIVEGLLWSFWPRLMEDTPARKKFSCIIEVEGDCLDLPRPEDFPPLDLFCKAMRAARKGEGNDVRAIASQRPGKHLGFLAIERGIRSTRTPLVAEESLFPAVSQHIALMRPVELVVQYLKGSALPDENLEWAGVFLVDGDDEVERAFALSEPPAHDDWVPGYLEKGPARTYVRVALRDLESHALAVGNPPGGMLATTGDGPPLARVAGRLGAALEGIAGEGAGPSRRGATSGGGRKPARATASRPVFIRLIREDGRKLAIFSTDVRQDAERTGSLLNATASIALDGSASALSDDSIELPTIAGIRPEDGGEGTADIDRFELAGADGRFEILVSVPDGAAVTVEARVLRKDEA